MKTKCRLIELILNPPGQKPPTSAEGAPQGLRLISPRCDTERLNCSFVLTTAKLFSAPQVRTETNHLPCLLLTTLKTDTVTSSILYIQSQVSLFVLYNNDLMMTNVKATYRKECMSASIIFVRKALSRVTR